MYIWRVCFNMGEQSKVNGKMVKQDIEEDDDAFAVISEVGEAL